MGDENEIFENENSVDDDSLMVSDEVETGDTENQLDGDSQSSFDSVGDSHVDSLDFSILNDIKSGVDSINRALSIDDVSLPTVDLDDSSSTIDGYFVTVSGVKVYLPVDRIQYISRTVNDDLINLSSSTIYGYSLDNYGNRGGYYRLQSFSTMEHQYTSGYNTYWESVSAKGDNSNITFGQTGIHSFSEVMLFFIMIFLGAIFLFKKRG